ncbi:hypothetical protein GF407_07585 [candidate division KSB1 bacterium]|nr:hypothetical protein [candidate division KSB1 bacterium]
MKTDGAGSISWQVDAGSNDLDTVIGNEVTDANDASLNRTSTTPYKLSINTAHTNTWTVNQNFNGGAHFPENGIWNIYGRIGISTTSPDYMLDIAQTVAVNQNLSALHISEDGTDTGAYISSNFASQFVISGGAAYNNNTNPEMTAKNARPASMGSYKGNLYFNTDLEQTAGTSFVPSARMVVGGKGNVFIGDISTLPHSYQTFQRDDQFKLHVFNDSGESQIRFYKGDIETLGGGYLSSSFDHQFIISGGAYNTGSSWVAQSTSASIIGSYSGSLNFYTNSGLTAGNSFTANRRIFIESDGQVGIGNLSGAAHLLHLQGGAYCDGGAWVDGSSREYKKVITALNDDMALETLRSLQPVSFYYKQNDEDLKLGFIAEDVPDLVATGDRKGVAAMDITAILTKVVQKQQQLLKSIMQENRSLEERVSRLERQ